MCLRAWIGGEIDAAGVKWWVNFVDNYKQGLPSELGLLSLFDPRNGVPTAVMDASGITDMRTGAVTRRRSQASGTEDLEDTGPLSGTWHRLLNVRLLDRLFDFETIRVHSLRPESRNKFAERLSHDLGKEVVATADWQSCVEGADIVGRGVPPQCAGADAEERGITPGALVVPYGTMSAVELSLTDMMTKWSWTTGANARAASSGRSVPTSRRASFSRESLHAELGQIVAGLRPGREDDDETILFWHRGLSLSDIALGHAILTKAAAIGAGHRLRYA